MRTCPNAGVWIDYLGVDHKLCIVAKTWRQAQIHHFVRGRSPCDSRRRRLREERLRSFRSTEAVKVISNNWAKRDRIRQSQNQTIGVRRVNFELDDEFLPAINITVFRPEIYPCKQALDSKRVIGPRRAELVVSAGESQASSVL